MLQYFKKLNCLANLIILVVKSFFKQDVSTCCFCHPGDTYFTW